jgi:hypothetical protein
MKYNSNGEIDNTLGRIIYVLSLKESFKQRQECLFAIDNPLILRRVMYDRPRFEFERSSGCFSDFNQIVILPRMLDLYCQLSTDNQDSLHQFVIAGLYHILDYKYDYNYLFATLINQTPFPYINKLSSVNILLDFINPRSITDSELISN